MDMTKRIWPIANNYINLKKKKNMKLGLGTVQFGLDYGISNKTGLTDKIEIKKIIDYAASHGINIIDTAHCYSDSEIKLGEILPLENDFRIITKTQIFQNSPQIKKIEFENLLNTFFSSLKNLNCKSAYGLLIHHVDDLLKDGGEILYRAMLELKEKEVVKKIGISAYTPDQIDHVLKNYDIDLIQLPVNIFDQRLIRTGYLKKLKGRGIEIHARSAFLQGLIFMNPEKLSSYFDSIKSFLKKFHDKLDEMNLTPVQAALGFLNDIKEIDHIICGVNNVEQFKELVQANIINIDMNWAEEFAINDEKILNPANWLH